MSQPEKIIKSFKLHTGKTSIKQIGLIIMAALFFIGLVWLGGWGVNKQIQQTGQKEKLVNLSSLLEKENKKVSMPEGFPKDIPIIEPNNVLQAYIRDQQTKDITIVIESKKSVKENFDYYLDYGNDNNWQIDEARNATDKLPGKLLLRKDKLTLSFSFKDKETGGSETIISSTVFNLPVFLGPPVQPEQQIPADNLTNPFLNQPKPKEEKIPAKAGELPEGFSKDFPLNGKTEITEAYTLKVENQAGVVYVVKFKSDQTKEANIKFYQAWFKENNWFLSKQKPEDESTFVSASLPFRKAVEVEIVWWQTEADDFELPDAMSEVEVRWREFN